jgi:hypothetical protein
MPNMQFQSRENWGATVFLVWEDIAEVKSKLLLTLLASIYEVGANYKPSV